MIQLMSGLLVFLDGNYKLIRDVVINSTKVKYPIENVWE